MPRKLNRRSADNIIEPVQMAGNTVDNLIIALRDSRVVEAIASVLDSKLLPIIAELKEENAKKCQLIKKLNCDLQSANSRIEALEQYTRRDNLLIAGLPIQSSADATAEEQPNKSLETTVLKLFNDRLGVSVNPSDISITHRLKKRVASDPRPPMTIVRFANRKAREAVYSVRRQLRSVGPESQSTPRIFINEDLNKTTANIFHQARQLVRRKLIYSAWTSSCAVFIKESADPNCRPRKILSIGDLPQTSAN
jgi:hypothetical protein